MSKHLYEEIDELSRVIERLNDRIAALEAENERLRKALEICAPAERSKSWLTDTAWETARAALEVKPGPSPMHELLAGDPAWIGTDTEAKP